VYKEKTERGFRGKLGRKEKKYDRARERNT
jgi:hypothetical protein